MSFEDFFAYIKTFSVYNIIQEKMKKDADLKDPYKEFERDFLIELDKFQGDPKKCMAEYKSFLIILERNPLN